MGKIGLVEGQWKSQVTEIHPMIQITQSSSRSSQGGLPSSQPITPLTPLDSIEAVFRTTVSVATILNDMSSDPMDALRIAAQAIVDRYPLLSARLAKKDNSPEKAPVSCFGGSLCCLSSPSVNKKEWWRDYSLVNFPSSGLQLGAIQLPLSPNDVQDLIALRRGYSMTSTCKESLPCYLQSLDSSIYQTSIEEVAKGRSRNGDFEPLARIQLSYLKSKEHGEEAENDLSSSSNNRRGNRSVVIGLTMSHIIGDGFTAGLIWLELLTVLQSELSKARGIKPVISSLPGIWTYDRAKAGLVVSSATGDQADDASKSVSPSRLKIAPRIRFSMSKSEMRQKDESQSKFNSITFSPLNPSLGSFAAWRKMASASVRAIGALMNDARRFGLPSILNGIPTSTLLIHIPQSDLERLRSSCMSHMELARRAGEGGLKREPIVVGSKDSGQALSVNSVLSGLIWALTCSIRGRPLPGQPIDPLKKGGGGKQQFGGLFGITADLRFNLIRQQARPTKPAPPAAAASDEAVAPKSSNGDVAPSQASEAKEDLEGKSSSTSRVRSAPLLYLGNYSCGLHARGSTSSKQDDNCSLGLSILPAWRDAKSNDELIDRAALRSIEQDLEDNRHQLKMKSSKGGGLGGERWGIGRSHVNDDVACDSRMPSLLSLVTNAALLVNHGVGKMRQLASDSHSTSPAPNGPADMVGGSQKRGLLSMVVERFSSHASSSQVQRDEALYRYVSGFDGFLTSLASFPPPHAPSADNKRKIKIDELNGEDLIPPSAALLRGEGRMQEGMRVRSMMRSTQVILHPLGPWSAIAIPSDMHSVLEPYYGDGGGNKGVCIFFSVPSCSVEMVKRSPLLKGVCPKVEFL